MHIERLKIKGFGKLNDLELTFGKGFNLIYGENESGKSTLLWFIKAMLYGLKGGKPKDGLPPPLKRLKPWNGLPFGGIMEYRLDDGSFYRVERDFDTNLVKVYDDRYNDVTAVFSSGRDKLPLFAEKHLGLNESCFEKTVMVRQLETRIDGEGTGELRARLANARGTGFEDTSYKRAETALSFALLNYVGTDRTSTRPLDKVLAELEVLRSERRALAEKRQARRGAALELSQRKALKDQLEKRRDFILALRELAEIRLGLDRAISREAGLRDAARRLGEVLAGIDKAEKRLEQVSGNPQMPGMNRQTAMMQQPAIRRQRRKQRSGTTILAAFSAATVITAIYGFLGKGAGILAPSHFLAAAAILSVGTAISAILVLYSSQSRAGNDPAPKGADGGNSNPDRSGNAGEQGEDSESLILKEIMELTRRSGEILSEASLISGKQLAEINALNLALSEISAEQDLLDRRLELGIGSAQTLAKALGQMAAGLCEQHEGIYEPAAELHEPVRELYRPAAELHEPACELYAADLLEAAVKDSSPVWLNEAVDSELQSINAAMGECALDIKEAETLLRDDSEDAARMLELEAHIALLEERRDRLSGTGEALKLALDVLTASGLQIRHEFGPLLDSKMSAIIGRLTGGRYSDLRADDVLSLKAPVPGQEGIRQAEALSGGTTDQMYLSMRLALADLLAPEEEALPVFLDEVFSQYDDNRIVRALEYFRDECPGRQYVLFTCKKRETELVGDIFGETQKGYAYIELV